MKKVALISVSDKTHLIDLCHFLSKKNYRILATGGTLNKIRSAGITAESVEDYTLNREILDGRVKTLHPKIFAGLLFNTEESAHRRDLESLDASAIDLLVCNLYPFLAKPNIENIDIGGVSLLRAAAKNYRQVICLSNPGQYREFMDCENTNTSYRKNLALAAFRHTAQYDTNISSWLGGDGGLRPPLRYGENPQQKAYLQTPSNGKKLDSYFQVIYAQKEVSYNNYLDLEAAIDLVSSFNSRRSLAIIKHCTPCGVAWCQEPVPKVQATDLYAIAKSCDPKSYFGGIVAYRGLVDLEFARTLNADFLECVAASAYSEEALTELKKKKNLRLIKFDFKKWSEVRESSIYKKSFFEAELIQDYDSGFVTTDDLELVSDNKTNKDSSEFRESLLLGLKVAKHARSNAIVLFNTEQTIGIGAGQTSRIDALEQACERARKYGHKIEGSFLASDGFFPFADSIETAAKYGIKTIIQPGGSIRDKEVIACAKKLGISMYFTQKRFFKH